MEPFLQAALRRALAVQAGQLGEDTSLLARLCGGLAEHAGSAVQDVLGRYMRIMSATTFEMDMFLAALHHAALNGSAPELAGEFPSCGGRLEPTESRRLAEQVEASLSRCHDEVLSFMLEQTPVSADLEPALLVLLGALTVQERFGGGLSLVELGAGGGLRLCCDLYACRIGQSQFTAPAAAVASYGPLLAAELRGDAGPIIRLAGREVPAVVGRRGLDSRPLDLTDPAQVLLARAFLPPDEPERHRRLEAAARVLAGLPVGSTATAPHRPALLQGGLEEFPALLLDAYEAMPPGNTLVLAECGHWTSLSGAEQKQAAYTVQLLASRLQAHKPLAWLQAEPFSPGAKTLELRVRTFGWANPEDREVRRLAEAAPDLSWIRWLEEHNRLSAT